MALRRAAVGTATAGLVTALTALVLSTLPALAHEGEEEGEGKDAIGEVDPDYPTTAILGDGSGPGASCVDGQAAYFPCRNVNLASYLPMSDIGGGRGSDVWGWTDPETDRRYAIAGRDNGTAFVEHKDVFGLTVRATVGNVLNARHRKVLAELVPAPA